MKLGKLLAFAFACAMALGAAAQAFPSRATRIIVPYPAGGDHDALGRGIAQRRSEKWKQPVIVDNRPGGGAAIGA